MNEQSHPLNPNSVNSNMTNKAQGWAFCWPRAACLLDFSGEMLISGRLGSPALYVSVQRHEDSAGRSCLVSVNLECLAGASDTLCESA